MAQPIFDAPWIEKYRPQKLEDVVGNQDVVQQLKTIIEQGNVPNMIMNGPPGCGKTTSVMALAHELLGDNFSKATLELNASDERGIDVVRERIKAFANQKVPLPEKRHKIIILDEADALTIQAQQALRVIISDFAATTRFALACNDSTKLIDAIQSRCCLLRFTKLSSNEIKDRLLKVINAEKIEYDETGLNDLVETSNGDMRQALNNLQSTAVGFGVINHENVYSIVDIPKPEKIMAIMNDCKSGNLDGAIEKSDELYSEGYSSLDIITVCGRIIKADKSLNDDLKFKLLKIMFEYKMRFLDGINSFVQMYGLISKFILTFQENNVNVNYAEPMDISEN